MFGGHLLRQLTWRALMFGSLLRFATLLATLMVLLSLAAAASNGMNCCP
jgi:hypothetical protein